MELASPLAVLALTHAPTYDKTANSRATATDLPRDPISRSLGRQRKPQKKPDMGRCLFVNFAPQQFDNQLTFPMPPDA